MKLYEIIEPRLLEKRGLEPPQPPLDPALVFLCLIKFCILHVKGLDIRKYDSISEQTDTTKFLEDISTTEDGNAGCS